MVSTFSILNVKALVSAFKQEKEGPSLWLWNLREGSFEALVCSVHTAPARTTQVLVPPAASSSQDPHPGHRAPAPAKLTRPRWAPSSRHQAATATVHQLQHPATMPAKDQGFTEDQIEDFKEVFQLFDTKGDGLIQVDMRIWHGSTYDIHSGSIPLTA